MDAGIGETVTVPDVVGLPFEVARQVADAAGVSLANPDPDGAPIGAIAWQREVWVGWQDPQGGIEVTRWSSVRVELVEDGEAEVPARLVAPATPPALSAQAESEPED